MIMNRLFPLWLLVIMSACASVPVRSTGFFLERPAPNALHELARAAARELGFLYPPAHTEISFAHPTGDAFGAAFLTELRGLGFAVSETRTRGSQLQIAYVVDEVESLYRVVLRVVASGGRQFSLTRAFTHHADAARAAGAWTQQVAR
jgi:N-acyl-D-aspartate/D-glutamate deacylase